ncbi:MAG: hypothetical protein ABSB82_17050 [Terriglobia bacterium]|jgi:hypothetical protein
MDLYEQLVGIYLTVFEHLAVVPQFPVLFDANNNPCFEESPGKRTYAAHPDFLAVDIKRRQAQVVQVRKSQKSGEALQLTDWLTTKRPDGKTDAEIIGSYVKWFVGEEFAVHWRFFVRAQNVNALEERLQQASQTAATITALEDVFEKLKNVMP